MRKHTKLIAPAPEWLADIRAEAKRNKTDQLTMRQINAEIAVARREKLKADIKRAVDQMDRGEFTTYDSPDEILKHVKAEGRKRLAAERRKQRRLTSDDKKQSKK